MPDALAISAPQSASSREAASAQVTIPRSMGVAPVPDGRPPGRVLHHARGRGPGGGRSRGRDERPDIGALAQVVGRDVAQEQGVEHALPRIGPEVPREHRVGHLHAGRGGREPRAEDQAVAAVGQVVRKGEGLLGQPGQAVAHLARQGGEEGQAERDVVDDRGRQRRVEPVHDPHGRLGDHHRAPDGDEEEDPLGVVLPRAAEGGAEQGPGEPGDARDPGQGHEGPAAGDRGDRVQEVDQIGPAAQGEELVHGRVLPILFTGPLRRPGRRRGPP